MLLGKVAASLFGKLLRQPWLVTVSLILIAVLCFTGGVLAQRTLCRAGQAGIVERALKQQQEVYEENRKVEAAYVAELEENALSRRVITRDVIRYVQTPADIDCTLDTEWMRILAGAARGGPEAE